MVVRKEIIEQLLSIKDKNQRDLAKAVDMNEKTFSYKKISGRFSKEEIEKMASFFGVDESELYTQPEDSVQSEMVSLMREQNKFLKEQNDFLKEQVVDLRKKLETNSGDLHQNLKINQVYLKVIYLALQKQRSLVEKVPLKKIQDDMDKRLASMLEEELKMDR